MSSNKPLVIPALKKGVAAVQNKAISPKKSAVNDKLEVRKVNNAKLGQGKSIQTPNSNWNKNKNKIPWWKSVNDNDAIGSFEQQWYLYLPQFLSETQKSGIDEKTLPQVVTAVETQFQKLLLNYESSKKNSDVDQKWINNVIKAGTFSDKVAALALQVQEQPLFSLAQLDGLISMASKMEQRNCLLAIEALKDLLVNNLLPDRKLTPFKQQPLTHEHMNMKTAILLWFEGQLKDRVEKIIAVLENALKSNIDFYKKQCLVVAGELLMSKPEQEARLLSLIVNKLGDPSSLIASKAIEQLKLILKTHDAMKPVIVREVRQLIYRPNMKLRSIFNGIIFLSQVALFPKDSDVASQLVECYLSLFEKAMKEEELGSRLLSALLTGINKAIPFVKDMSSVERYADSIFRIVHTASSLASSTQALMLLSYIATSKTVTGADGKKARNTEFDKRYYRTLYGKLLSNQISMREKNTLFLNLLYRSVKRDASEHRAMAFIKRMMMSAAQATPPIAAGILFMVSEILKARPALLKMITEAEMETGSKPDEADYHQFGCFDASKREPEFAIKEGAGAVYPALWELSLMRLHYHPSVDAFCSALMESEEHQIFFEGDPTVDFNLMSFLNRFAYKNPKQAIADKLRIHNTKKNEDPINVGEFIQTAAEQVEPDKQFFHKFFTERDHLRTEGKSRDRSRRRRGDDGELDAEAEEEEMDRFADQLAEQMMRDHELNNNPDLDDDDDFSEDPEGGDDEEVDVELDDADIDMLDDDDDENEEEDGRGAFRGRRSREDEFSSDGEDFLDLDAASEDDQGEQPAPSKKNDKRSRRVSFEEEDYGGLEVYQSDDEDQAATKPVVKGKLKQGSSSSKATSESKGQKRKKDKDAGDFADAEDYQAEMDAIIAEIQQNQEEYAKEASAADDNKSRNKKRKKN